MVSVASPTKYAGTATDTSGTPTAWANINNSKVKDSAYAIFSDGTGAAWSHGGGGIALTNYGFSIPTNAVIDGIQLVVTHYGLRIAVTTATLLNVTGTAAKTPSIGLTGADYSVGGPADLWGAGITPAQLNSSSFGVSFVSSITSSPADALYAIDAAAIIVYYHLGGSTTPADVPTREYYKVKSQQGQFLGLLPVTEPFKLAQDINSLGSQVTIKVPVSSDTSAQATEIYTAEDGITPYTNEAATDNYTTEGVIPIVSAAFQGIDTLIKNGNTVEMWVVNYWYPNGKCMFVGKIRRWEADFGGDSGDNSVSVILYSSGYDLDNYVTRGAPFTYTNDQVQTNYNAADTALQYGDKGAGWHLDGQSFIVGVGVTNIGAVSVALIGTANVTVNLYSAVSGGTLLGSVRQSVSVGVATGIQFGLPNLVTVLAGQTLFFTVTPDPGQSIQVCYMSGNPYAGGSMYTSDFGGGSGGAWTISSGNDLWFVTASGTPSTSATFTSKDPTTGMIAPIITDYNLRGGSQVWTVASIDATGLSLTYRFNVQTIYEAMQAVLSLCPNGFYYYVDLGTQTIYFKNASITADFTFIKGVHINNLKLITTTENSKNLILATGGEVSAGVNLYRQYTNNASILALGPLLDRKTDTRVTINATMDAIGNSEIAELSGEQFQTTTTIMHTKRLDITLLVPGKVVALRGYGTFVDQILAQIVHREWMANYVVLTLGVLPIRLSTEYENTTRSLIASQTTDNPSAPS